MDDRSLIERIIARDKRSLHIFYHTYAPKLSRLIHTKIANPKDVEEVLQDTLFAFLESIRDYTGKATLSTYLYAICNHKIVDFYRRKKILHTVFSLTPNLESLISPVLNPEEAFDAVLLKGKIKQALRSLVPQYRSVLSFRYIENLSVAEIAARLTITLKSVESRLFRARRAFVEAFLSI